MATSLSFNPNVKDLLPHEVVEKHSIIPLVLKKDKLCLIARRPLSDQALMELKTITGIEDYELQIVGEDVINCYMGLYKKGTIYDLV